MTISSSQNRHDELLDRYAVPSMGAYTAIGGEVPLILERLDRNRALSLEDKKFIRDKGLLDLCRFVEVLEKTGVQDFGIFDAARFNAPKCSRGDRRGKLWDKYGIKFIDSPHMSRMISILEKVEKDERIDADARIWLVEHNYNFSFLNRAIHTIEAKWYLSEFDRTGDFWAAVNASSNFRKAGSSSDALKLLERIEIDSKPDKHLKSALCTTKGGALRDLRHYDEAMQLAKRAHSFDSKSFHPCTLIGAIHFELKEYDLGEKWFAMAVERGATRGHIDSEIRSILRRLDKDQKQKLINHLLKSNPARYHWLKLKKSCSKSKRGNA